MKRKGASELIITSKVVPLSLAQEEVLCYLREARHDDEITQSGTHAGRKRGGVSQPGDEHWREAKRRGELWRVLRLEELDAVFSAAAHGV